MLIDTHCHLNMMVKKEFDRPLSAQEIAAAQEFITHAQEKKVDAIINVGTSLIESKNCVALAQQYAQVYATIGIHPNDATQNWKEEIKILEQMLKETERGIIVGIGECGIDKHYPDYNINRQRDAFKAQIELSLEYKLPLVIHNRDGGDETLACLAQYQGTGLRGTIHCFSEDLSFAQEAIKLGFVLGMGGTITYPKNNILREVVKTVTLKDIILETDAPFLPIQRMRGKQNAPQYISEIAQAVAEIKNIPFEQVAEQTTATAQALFSLLA